MANRRKEAKTTFGKDLDLLMKEYQILRDQELAEESTVSPSYISKLRSMGRPGASAATGILGVFASKGMLFSDFFQYFKRWQARDPEYLTCLRYYPSLTPEEWKQESITSLESNAFPESLYEFLAHISKAPRLDNGKKPQLVTPSGFMTSYQTKISILDDGFVTQTISVEIVQCREDQDIITPIFVDLKKESLRIFWRGQNITDQINLENFEKAENIFSVDEDVDICYGRKSVKVKKGEKNRLVIEATSRLQACDLDGGVFAACFPYFYALDPQFSLKWPSKIEVLSKTLLFRTLNNGVKADFSGWEEEILDHGGGGQRFDYNEKKWDSVIPKRFCPDLIAIQFRASKKASLPNMVILKSRPLACQGSFSFFCGRDEEYNCSNIYPPSL